MLDTDTTKKNIIKKFYKLYQKEPTRFPKKIQSALSNVHVTRKKLPRKPYDKNKNKRRRRPKHNTPPPKAKKKLRFTKEK